MKLLVLGGTVFLGRHIVEAALAEGHQVTLLNRGRHAPTLFPQVETLIGDRDAEGDNALAALRGRRFDAAIDCSGYTPAQVRRTLAALGGTTTDAAGIFTPDAVGFYVFISSISAHARFPPGAAYDEDAPLAEGHAGYGALKARSEEAVRAALPGRAAIVRPGLIVGPHDPTGRFTYWPCRVARCGDDCASDAVLAPGRPERPVQFIDARDLARWCLHLATQRIAGTFNAVGPNLTMVAVLDACATVAVKAPRFVWVDDATLLAEGISPWTGLPLWLPEQEAEFGGMLLADNRRALAAGLGACLTPLHEAIADTLRWTASQPALPWPHEIVTKEVEDRVLRRHLSTRTSPPAPMPTLP